MLSNITFYICLLRCSHTFLEGPEFSLQPQRLCFVTSLLTLWGHLSWDCVVYLSLQSFLRLQIHGSGGKDLEGWAISGTFQKVHTYPSIKTYKYTRDSARERSRDQGYFLERARFECGNAYFIPLVTGLVVHTAKSNLTIPWHPNGMPHPSHAGAREDSSPY